MCSLNYTKSFTSAGHDSRDHVQATLTVIGHHLTYHSCLESKDMFQLGP